SRWNPRSWELGGHRPAWLDNQPITAFADASHDQLWIASLAGLVRFDMANGSVASFDSLVGRRHALGDRPVTSLRQDRRGALWIGTMGSGVKILTPNGVIKSIPVQPGGRRSLSSDRIMA